MSTDGEVEQPVQPGTVEGVEVPQPQVAATEAGEAHQPSGLEPIETTTDEDVRSTRADPSAAAPSAPALDMPTTIAQHAEEDDIIPVTRPGTQLQTYSPEFVGLMRSWFRLLNQASVFDGQLRVSLVLCCFLCATIF